MSVKFVYKCPACPLHHSTMDDALYCCELETKEYFLCHSCANPHNDKDDAANCCQSFIHHAWHCTYCGIVDHNEKEHKCTKNVVRHGDNNE